MTSQRHHPVNVQKGVLGTAEWSRNGRERFIPQCGKQIVSHADSLPFNEMLGLCCVWGGGTGGDMIDETSALIWNVPEQRWLCV